MLSRFRSGLSSLRESGNGFPFWIYPGAIICTGFILRLRQYLFNRSFWQDECLVALNITRKPVAELFGPLDLHQAAPPGFLAVVKGFVTLFGNNEYAFRLYPLILGTVSLVAFQCLASACLERKASLIALALFAVSDPLVYFSSEFKPYIGDALLTVLLLILAIIYVREGESVRLSAALGAVGVFAPWFSFASVFILGGIGLILLGSQVRRPVRGVIRLMAMSSSWMISLGLLWFISLRHIAREGFLWKWWDTTGGFLPLSLSWSAAATWMWHFPISVMKDPSGMQIAWLGLALTTIGIGRFLLADRKTGLLFLLPILLTLMSSALRYYPLSGRLMLFLAPIVLVLAAHGTSFLMDMTGRFSKVLAVVLPVLLLTGPAMLAGKRLIHPRQREEVRALSQYVARYRQSNDVVFLWWTAKNPYRYYSNRYGITLPTIVGSIPKGKMKTVFREIERVKKWKRAWVIFTGNPGKRSSDEERAMINHLDAFGTRLDQIRAHGASLYLYQIG